MLPSERLELAILTYTRIPSAERWRATTLPSLAVAVQCTDWNEVSDAITRLYGRRIMRMRKWFEPTGFVHCERAEDVSQFMCTGEFQLEITAEGRTYMELLDERSKSRQEVAKIGSESKSIVSNESLGNIALPLDTFRNQVSGRSIVNQHIFEAMKGMEDSSLLGREMRAAIDAMTSDRNLFYKELVDSFKVNHLEYEKAMAIAVQPTLTALSQIGEQLSKQMAETTRIFEKLSLTRPYHESLARVLDQSGAIAGLSLGLPVSMKLNWPTEIIPPCQHP